MGSKVAMNSFRNGGWQTEEFASENPFKKGEAFEMFIVPKPEGYQVFVNGKEHYMFKHRMPLETVTALNIVGHINANLFGFIENWSIPSFTKESKTTITSLGSSRWGLSTEQSEVLHPVQNPILPYVGTIPGGLRAGMALYLQGVIPTNADKFAINFKTGQSDKDDVAFHFNPRMGSKVAMNSFRNGGWQTEEFVSENPFKKGEAFEMFIVPKPEGYQVFVNGKEHYMFKHRMPLETVTALNIVGHINVNLFGFIENWSIPSFTKESKTTITSLGSSRWGLSTEQSEVLHPVQNPILPYVGTIPGGLRAGMALYLQGVIPTNADKFAINFKTGQSDKDDVAFHFNPRMGSKVAMNSFRNGGWQTEEFVSENPFKKGEAFEMFIVPKPEGYQVFVNGKEHYMFKHRMPLETVTALNIVGHINANLFGFIENWSIPSFTKESKTTITSLGSSRWGLSTVQSEVLHPVQNPTLPYEGPIAGGLRAGMALYFDGNVPTNADRFSINFKTGQSVKDDIAFHFNPRMGSKVVMNSFRNGRWQTEEFASQNPFKKGEAFSILIGIKSDGYKVHVKGQELFMFKHRIPLEKVTTLNIKGNVSISFFGFIMDK
ncbi:galectin-4 isoform X23 [Xyrauchen texanus]|uniref:galectin-4 isoform X23 n=1 Tax=Xyrauchen texanus TaxID=154827 RepID=UPI00224234B7|nr:galectin-4 isoform X23 [Xyrauchen texanus]